VNKVEKNPFHPHQKKYRLHPKNLNYQKYNFQPKSIIMDTCNDNVQEEQNDQGITVGLNTLNDLRIAGQWGKLMAVVGFIGIG
jgi:hypothetical protein